MQRKVTCYQANSNVHKLDGIEICQLLKDKNKDYLIGHQKLAENLFQPLTISLEQSSPKGQEGTSSALKVLTEMIPLLCNVIICYFPVAYFCKYLQEVFITSMTISHEKTRTLKCSS